MQELYTPRKLRRMSNHELLNIQLMHEIYVDMRMMSECLLRFDTMIYVGREIK